MITTTAPLRLSLAGGGTDLPEHYEEFGCRLLAVTLDLTVTVTVNGAPSGLRFSAFGAQEHAPHADSVANPLVRAALRHFGITDGVELTVQSDVLPGSGLGGSGAFMVALTSALAQHIGKPVTTDEAARLAFHLEREKCGFPVGQQDHWTAACGGALELRIDRGGNATTTELPELRKAVDTLLDSELLLLRTPITRAAGAPLAAHTRALKSRQGSGMGTIQNMVDAFHSALTSGDIDRVGALLDQHWQAKRRFNSAVTSPQIDRWYETLLAHGALGAKVVGAGGGGHLLVAVPAAHADRVSSALASEGLRRVAVRVSEDGVRTA
jgi:D-glycero-alpha-D-manno-heptose-7-phosphate kinase